MGEIEEKIIPIFKGAVMNALGAEELFIEAAKDLVKDEIKRHLKEILNKHPDIRDEFRDAIRLYFEARLKQAYAGIKMAKTSAKLGLELIPDDLRESFAQEFMKIFEKEITSVLEKTF